MRYEGAGTVEFLVEGGALGPAAPWYFIEMNTRLQVEHPVTEAITGLDLVEWQLRVACGREATARAGADRDVGTRHRGAAQRRGPGQRLPAVHRAHRRVRNAGAGGARVDAGVEAGSTISPFYNSMIAKLIAHGADRPQAIARLSRGLEDTVIAGPKTNAAFLHALIEHPAFVRGEMDTGLIGRELGLLAPARFDARAVSAGVVQCSSATRSGWREMQLALERAGRLPAG